MENRKRKISATIEKISTDGDEQFFSGNFNSVAKNGLIFHDLVRHKIYADLASNLHSQTKISSVFNQNKFCFSPK